jgi:hypothetical protein
MEFLFANKYQIGRAAGLFGALVALTVGYSAPSQAGIVNTNNATNAVGAIVGAAVGAATGGAVVGSFAGPPSAIALGAGAAAGVVATSITYTVVTQSIKHPAAAIQTVQVLNPITAPAYIISHPVAVFNGAKQIWNYLFN